MYNTAAIADVTPNLAQVLDHPGIWRRSAAQQPRVRALPTGWDTLDARLPGGGWPQGALSEILFEQDGLGELDLLSDQSFDIWHLTLLCGIVDRQTAKGCLPSLRG